MMQPMFPNLQVFGCESSAQSVTIEKTHGWLNLWRGGMPPFDQGDLTYAMIESCTATDEEISKRSEFGEFGFDVIDEHMSRLWFHDRSSFKAAWGMARSICHGRLVECDCGAGEILGVDRINHRPVAPFVVTLSAHHIAPPEAA